MQNYSDLVLFNGQPLAGASVSVLNYPSGSLATIYIDNGITVGPNPITTNSLGRYNFYAANGRYSLQIAYPNTTTQTILDFPLEDDPANPQVANITSGTIANVAISNSTATNLAVSNSSLTNTTATTNSRLENTGLVATDAFVNQQISSSIATIPATTTGGTYNQASLGSGLSVTVSTSGGVITGINSVPAGGANYAVGDVLVLASGNQDAIIRITAVSGGVVSMGGVSVVYGGTGYSNGQQASAVPVPPGQRSIVFSGTLTSNLLLIVQGGTYLNASRRLQVINNTTGAFTTTVKLTNGAGGSTGTGVVIPQGTNNSTAMTLFTDGVNDVWSAVGATTALTVGGTMTATGAQINGNEVVTGTITPSQTNGIVGTATNNNANAGSWGEYITASWSATSLSTTVIINAASISLTAGDWDVSGGSSFTGSSSVVSNAATGISTTSATFGASGTFWQVNGPASFLSLGNAMPTARISVASTTTVFAVCQATFASGTCTTSGTIRARRIR